MTRRPPLRKPLTTIGRLTALVLAGLTALAGFGATALVLLPPLSWEAWQYGLLALEFSLVLAALSALGLVLALLSRPRRARPDSTPGARRVQRVRHAAVAVAAANAAVLAMALAPPTAIWSTARAEGVRLDLGEYAAGLATSADREPDTRVYLRINEGAGAEEAAPNAPGAVPEEGIAADEGSGVHELEMDVWEPSGRTDDTPLPIVVNIHGGADDLPQSLLPRWDTWLADSGHVVFDADYRYFPDGDWSAPVSDVKCAIGWAREHAEEYGADPGRVAVTGQSAGGLLALLAAYTTAEEVPPSCDVPDPGVDAVVAWYSVTDGTADAPEVPWRQRHSPISGELIEGSERMMGGTVAELPREYAMSSPLLHVSPDVPPTMLVMSGHDLFLGVEDNRRMADRLSAAGVANRHLEIPWSEHMFDLNWGGFASQLARHGIDGFLREHLAP